MEDMIEKWTEGLFESMKQEIQKDLTSLLEGIVREAVPILESINKFTIKEN